MTPKTFLSAFFLITIVSCTDTQTQDAPKQETPKALEDNSSLYESSYKRGYDIVESLYSEQVSKDKELKKMEDAIKELAGSGSDSMEAFTQFNDKNQAYYNSADRSITEINDSVLKDKLQKIVSLQRASYSSLIAKESGLIKEIEANRQHISDLHIALKITKTLPLVDKYQKDHQSDTKPMEGYIKRQQDVIKLLDTMSRK